MTIQTAPGTGGLSFVTNPPGATILLEGNEYPYKTPAAIVSIPPGNHAFVLKMEGYEDFSDTAEVIESRMCCIDTDLMAAQTKRACSPTPLEIIPVPTVPPPPPDYKMLIIGLLAGIVIVFLLEKIKK